MHGHDETQSSEAMAESLPNSVAAVQDSAAAILDAAPAESAVMSAPEPTRLAVTQPAFVYALGQIEPRFPTLAIEKEYAQVIARRDADGVTDRQLLVETISEPQNRYLARQMCWCFSVEGLETYILVPRDPDDLRLLIGAVRDDPGRDDIDIVIGTRGGIAPPEMCNGLAVPVVVFDLIYSFDRDTLVKSIPVPESIAAKDRTKFQQTAGAFFDDVMKLADNAGATDDHRALNYVATRYAHIYTALAESRTETLRSRRSRLSPRRSSRARIIVDVVLSFVNRTTGVTTKHSLQVDVTEEWPSLLSRSLNTSTSTDVRGAHMLTPNFTAESAVYRGSRAYAGGAALSALSANRVVPQQNADLLSTCGACSCDPGKCCYQSAGECACYTCPPAAVKTRSGFLVS